MSVQSIDNLCWLLTRKSHDILLWSTFNYGLAGNSFNKGLQCKQMWKACCEVVYGSDKSCLLWQGWKDKLNRCMYFLRAYVWYYFFYVHLSVNWDVFLVCCAWLLLTYVQIPLTYMCFICLDILNLLKQRLLIQFPLRFDSPVNEHSTSSINHILYFVNLPACAW